MIDDGGEEHPQGRQTLYWHASGGDGPATIEAHCYASSAWKGDGQRLVKFWVGHSGDKKGKNCAMRESLYVALNFKICVARYFGGQQLAFYKTHSLRFPTLVY